MKRIKIETTHQTYYAAPFTLGQLEENEGLLKEIYDDSEALKRADSSFIPVALLRKQSKIVLIGLQNHDPGITEAIVSGFSAFEISIAMSLILSGSGLEEVTEEKNAAPVA